MERHQTSWEDYLGYEENENYCVEIPSVTLPTQERWDLVVLDLRAHNEGEHPNSNHVSYSVGDSENREGASEKGTSVFSLALGLPELDDWYIRDRASLVESSDEVAGSSPCFYCLVGRTLVVSDKKAIHLNKRLIVVDVWVLDAHASGLHLVVEHSETQTHEEDHLTDYHQSC